MLPDPCVWVRILKRRLRKRRKCFPADNADFRRNLPAASVHAYRFLLEFHNPLLQASSLALINNSIFMCIFALIYVYNQN